VSALTRSWRLASFQDIGVRYVFVHGFTQAAGSWDPVCRALGAEDAVAVTVPDDAGFETTALALDRGAATYVGYSMGGRLCLQLALDRPALVERLVLISASPGIDDPTARADRVVADERLAQEIERDGVDAFLERWLAQPLFATLPRARAGVDERRAVNTVTRLTHQLRALGQGTQPSNWPRLASLSMPVLLVVGVRDTKYTDIARRMATDVPRARVEVIPSAGHACHLEHPEVVAHLVSSWASSS
jgi:2-succinyl-6-hydroxy-2,4-cyclohexadiene-1-carboxylate synthase